jgi:hypothetical protein
MIPTKPSQTEPYGSFVSARASDLWHKATAQLRTWSTLYEEERPLRRLQRLLLSSPNQDGSHQMHRATKKSGLTKSADGSIARRTQSSSARPRGGRHVS